MTFGMIAALITTLMAGVTLVTLGLWRMRQRDEAIPFAEAGEMAPSFVPASEGFAAAAPEIAAALSARVEGLIAEQTRRQADVLTVALAGLKADIQHLKSDVEWLAGERMIEQAILLAQSGMEADDIGRDLGLTRETAETIAAFRKH